MRGMLRDDLMLSRLGAGSAGHLFVAAGDNHSVVNIVDVGGVAAAKSLAV